MVARGDAWQHSDGRLYSSGRRILRRWRIDYFCIESQHPIIHKCVAYNDAPSSTYAYAYGTTGLPSSIVSTLAGVTDSRAFKENGDQLTAGTHQETLDALGRATSVDAVSLTYGGNGEIASATAPTGSFTYLYDEKGQRVAKLSGGQIVQVFLSDGSTVSTTARTEPIRFAGTTIGTLTHPLGGGAKTFTLVASDQRGTSLSDAQGVARPVSPFGDRVVHPNVAAAVDFTSSRFDADLGLVRMGLRDYGAAGRLVVLAILIGVVAETLFFFVAPRTLARLAFLPLRTRLIELTPAATKALASRAARIVTYRATPPMTLDLALIGGPARIDTGNTALFFIPQPPQFVSASTFSLITNNRYLLRVDLETQGERILALKPRWYPYPLVSFLPAFVGASIVVKGIGPAFVAMAVSVIFFVTHRRGCRDRVDAVMTEVSKRLRALEDEHATVPGAAAT